MASISLTFDMLWNFSHLQTISWWGKKIEYIVSAKVIHQIYFVVNKQKIDPNLYLWFQKGNKIF